MVWTHTIHTLHYSYFRSKTIGAHSVVVAAGQHRQYHSMLATIAYQACPFSQWGRSSRAHWHAAEPAAAWCSRRSEALRWICQDQCSSGHLQDEQRRATGSTEKQENWERDTNLRKQYESPLKIQWGKKTLIITHYMPFRKSSSYFAIWLSNWNNALGIFRKM